MGKCSIFTGGVIKDLSFINVNSVKNTFVICADSGYLYAKELKIEPDLLIGDYDSLGYVPEEVKNTISFPSEKDDTDLMLAVREALKHGYDSIDIYGALGGRFDHTFSNIQTLGFIALHNVKARILSDSEEISLLNPGKYTFDQRADFSLSLFAYSDIVEGLCIKGAKYPADKITLTSSFPLGMSNCIIEKTAEISFEKGRLLAIQSKIN